METRGVFGIPYNPLSLSAYICPEGGRCEFDGKVFYRKMATIKDLEDYFALGFKYLYVEAARSNEYHEREARGEDTDKTDLIYVLDLALEYEKKHGVGSCPCLILDMNVLAAQSHWIEFTDAVKEEVKKLYQFLKKEYSTVFAGYLLRDEPYLWFVPYFAEVYDYLYNDLGGKDLVYLWSLHPAGGADFPHVSASMYISSTPFDKGEIDISGFQEFLKNNDYGVTEDTYLTEYLYYLDSYAKALHEKGIKNVLFGCDFYPYRKVPELLCYNYCACLNAIATVVKKYDYDMFLTIQSYCFEGGVMTEFDTPAYLAQQAYIALAFGVKHLSYFTYLEHFSQSTGWKCNKAMMLWEQTEQGWETKKTELYDWTKDLNTELLEKYSILTAFDWVGTIVKEGERIGVLKDQQYIPRYEDASLKILQNDEDIIVGCLQNKETGVKAYLFINFAYPATKAGTHIAFTSAETLYDDTGKAIASNNKYEIELPYGACRLLFTK